MTGAEAGIAGGSAIVGQKLLEAVFGDQAVRRLAEAARRDLRVRVTELMDSERQRYLEVLEGLAIDPDDVDRLKEASRRVDDVRFAEKPPGGTPATLAASADGADTTGARGAAAARQSGERA